jgi:ankyrin repeat protein
MTRIASPTHAVTPSRPKKVGQNAMLLFAVILMGFASWLIYKNQPWFDTHPRPEIPKELRAFLDAVADNNLDAVRQMADANPSLVNQNTPSIGTSLHVAAWRNSPAMIDLLVEKGGDLDARGIWGGTPLHWAAWWGHKEAVDDLIKHGSDVESRCMSYGSTPLLWAAHGSMRSMSTDGDYVGVCDTLLAHGAKADTTNSDGIEAVDFATNDIAGFLVKHGAPLPTPRQSTTSPSDFDGSYMRGWHHRWGGGGM